MKNIDNLPKWARDMILDLNRERDITAAKLYRYESEQEKGPFSFFNWDGYTRTTKYFNASSMRITHAGVEVNVTLSGTSIDIKYEDKSNMTGTVNMQPKSFQYISLLKSK